MAKYPKSKQLGNKGESFFESLISDYALVHKIDGSKDVGVDFLCEWVHDENPTRLLFGVQVKTRSRIIMSKVVGDTKNLLEQFTVSSIKIKKTTLDYWRGFDFPIFLFLVKIQNNKPDCFYKRYTPILHNKSKELDEKFYKVIGEEGFLAYKYKKDHERDGGFCRDLFIDHLRCQHNKGMLSGIDPKDIGLKYYQKDVPYKDVFDHYKDKIKKTFQKYKEFEQYFN